jgi:HAD superfamily hydrolase (TIGR01509 family)
LLDSSRAIIDAVENVLKSRGLGCNRADVAEMIGMPLENIFAVLAPNLSTEEVWQLVLEYREYYMAHHLEHTSIYPSTRMLLTKLKARGHKLGIITGKYREPVIDALGHFGILEFFDAIVTGYEVKNHKPAPDIVLEAAKRLGVSPKECVIVGDSPLDVEAGKRAGSLTVAVLSNLYSRRQLENAKPTVIVEDLGTIQDM